MAPRWPLPSGAASVQLGAGERGGERLIIKLVLHLAVRVRPDARLSIIWHCAVIRLGANPVHRPVGEARRLHGDIVKPRLDAERRLAVFGGEKQDVDLVRRAPYRVAFGPFVDGENTKR
ncbi:hypothetical protein B296_00047606, partial [Ensete ventricosum]